MKTNDFREIQVSSSLLVVIFLGVLALGVFIFLLGVSVGKKQVRLTAENRTVAQQVQELPRDQTAVKPAPSGTEAPKTTSPATEPGTKAVPDSLAGGTSPQSAAPSKTGGDAPAVKAPATPPKTEAKPAVKQPSTDAETGLFYVQVAAFDERPMAVVEADKYKKRGYPVVVRDPRPNEKPAKYRVRLGGYPTRDKATQVLNKLNEEAKKKTGFFIARD